MGCGDMKRRNTSRICIDIAIMVLIIGALFMTGCVENKSASSMNEETMNTTENTSEPVESSKIKLTDNYSYKLPEGFVEAEEIFDDTVSETNCFATPDMTKQIRRWVYDGDFLFPDDVEAMNKDGNVQIGYGGLYDTAIARVTDKTEKNGKTIYRTLFVWPDGADHMCFIDLASFNEDYNDFEREIRESIRNRNAPSGTGTYGFHGEYPGVPSEEEIDNAMLQDAQEAYQEYLYELENPGDYHVYPFF